MNITVVIPTFNGANKIPTVLSALNRQAVGATFDVIVVIDGSSDATVSVIDEFRREAKYNIEVITQTNKGRAEAKNAGASRAQNGLLIFYDDDMEPDSNSIAKHFAFHSVHTNAILTGSALEVEGSGKSDVQNYKATLTQKWTCVYPDQPVEFGFNEIFFTSANCSMRKETYELIGGFNSMLTDAEDLEFAVRADEKGASVFFDKSNAAIHHDPITCKSYIRRQRQYRSAHQFLVDHYPDRFASRTLDVNTLRYQLKRIWFFLFSSSAWTDAVDDGKLLFLPRKFRYKLYDWIIQAQSVVFPKSY
jgi:glycosyltransferase involved in cell wall biosynthesis